MGAHNTLRRLGPNQESVLVMLVEHNKGTWFSGCGWHWSGAYTTSAILSGLVRRGYVRCVDATPALGERKYEATQEGREEVDRIRARWAKPRRAW